MPCILLILNVFKYKSRVYTQLFCKMFYKVKSSKGE